MSQALWFSFFFIVLFTACTSTERNPSSITADDEDVPLPSEQKIKDHLFQGFLIDTNQSFGSLVTLKDYKKEIDGRFKQLKDTQSFASNHTLDSLSYLNEDLYAYLLYKHLKDKEQTEQNVILLLYNFTFSNIVSVQDRLTLFNSFPQTVKKSKSGQFVLQKLNERLREEENSIGINISELASLQLADSVGKRQA